MTPNETRMLTDFLGKLRAVAGAPTDPQAAALIAEAVSAQPDAPYFLVQRALLQEQALAAANERIASLEAQLRASVAPVAPATSFLDSGNNAWGRSIAPIPKPLQTVPVESRTFTPAPAAAVAAPVSAGIFGGSGGNFLGTMAATAAGVAGGAFLFQGIGNLLGHHGDAAHASGLAASGQASPFSSMADSVGSTPSAAPAATPLLDRDVNEVSDVASNDVGIDDTLFGGDEAII